MEIDPRFKAARQNAKRRKRKSWVLPTVVAVLLGFALIGTGTGLYLGGYLHFGTQISADDEMQIDEGALIDNAAAYNSAFADLAGDPMVLRFDTSAAAEKTRKTLRPAGVPANRAGNDLLILSDEMVTSQEQLITTLPSSREDFAFFQAQKTASTTPALNPTPATDLAAPTGEVVSAEGEEASWGDDLDGAAETEANESYTKTRIEDTTSLTFVQPENRRFQPYEDIILRLKDAPDLIALMVDKGVDAEAAKRFVEDGKLLVPDIGALVPGHVHALRLANRVGMKVPVQLSLYTRNSYAGSVAVNDDGQVVLSVDPWVEEDLFSFAGEDAVAEADIGRKYRLLDAFYSAAIRNGVPSAVVAETIVMLSQSFDLESFAAPGDKMTLVYAPEAGSDGPGPGQVLYASIKGNDRSLECHVFLIKGAEDYACFGAGGAPSAGGGGVGSGALRSGLHTPVQGVMTSRFGPRMHPILKVAKLHRGVDWAAPIGTPVIAAFDGVIASAGDGKGYGNLIRMTHPNGLETRYAHLNAFADGIKTGVEVKGGTLIGYIGTTGLSTGPHLHFEVYEAGVAVDPLGSGGGGTLVAEGGGSAVETLVDQIIRVESGGKADAKNPLSSATGLGQFIESTWLRMMKQYRPDLASTMDRPSLLALRNDPTISREMVTALAREGEAYLRARGHTITAGRLYLCHFLGAEGANMALSAQDDQLVGDVMGSGVINANPFLKGRTIAYVKEWAELKMNKKFKGGGISAPATVVPAEVLAYQKIIAALIAVPT
jgi:murein DD-endopeptidase MepM/ murein hydrolase activator NlpD